MVAEEGGFGNEVKRIESKRGLIVVLLRNNLPVMLLRNFVQSPIISSASIASIHLVACIKMQRNIR